VQAQRRFVAVEGRSGIGRRAVADQILQPQHFVRLVKFEQLLISLSRILCRLFGRGIERGGVFRHNPAGGALLADGLEGELGEPVAHREPHRPPLEPLEPLEDRRIDEIANTQVSLGHRSTAFEIGQFAPDRVIDRIEVVLDQAEEKLAPPRLRRIPRGREWGANPAPAGGRLNSDSCLRRATCRSTRWRRSAKALRKAGSISNPLPAPRSRLRAVAAAV
jgi:hypothetical protein